ncbi:MAG: hypothetical protein OEU92_07895 [Alphaproteobacteria bacterium]|nr:hypothetical protein [Alphaproteobacteria bacterium]
MQRLLTATAILALVASTASALEPSELKGQDITAEDYAALVEAAMAKMPPRNGESYVFGFANLQRSLRFGILVEESIEANAEAAGVELLITDNRLDGLVALQNAESYIQQDVDYVIEFQTDVNFGPAVMPNLNTAF